MTILSRSAMTLALTAAFSLPLVALAVDKPADEHASHHPEQKQSESASMPTSKMQDHKQEMQARMETMQTRMKAMEKTSDPKARMSMMQEQMAEMQAQMKDMGSNCPMAGGKGGMGMMGGDKGGMMGHDMHEGGMGMGDKMKQPAK